MSEEASQMHINETEADVSIGTEIPDLDLAVEIQAQESLSSYSCTHEDPSTSSASLWRDDDHGKLHILYSMYNCHSLEC